MFDAPNPSLQTSTLQAAEQDRRVSYLRLVEDETYSDWESAYVDNVGRLYRLMYSRVGNRPDAEDLVAEVFKAALGPMRLSSSKGEVRAYLLATARTVLASHWRRRLGTPLTFIDPATDFAAFEDAPEPEVSSKAQRKTSEILSWLPDRYRRILELRFLEACSIRESARVMNISVSNAKVLQHRALHMATKVAELEQ